MSTPGASSWIWPLMMWQFDWQAAGSQSCNDVSQISLRRGGKEGLGCGDLGVNGKNEGGGRTICLQYSAHLAVSSGLFAVGTAVGKMGIVVVEDEKVVVGLGTVGGKRGRVESVVGTAVGKIPTAAGVDNTGDVVTGSGAEALAGIAVTPLSGRLVSVGTAVGKMGAKGTDIEAVMEVVTVFVTVNVSTTCRR